MKYFKELSSEDQERALVKLANKPTIRFNCLLRVKVPDVKNIGLANYKPASVVRMYWHDDELMVDVVYDSCPDKVFSGIYLENCKRCDTEYEPFKRSIEEINAIKKSLKALLTNGKHYVFDEKCNAYPV